jgi:hypothetical protein
MALRLRSSTEGSLDDFLVMHGDLKVGRIGKQKLCFTSNTQWYWTVNGIPSPLLI